MTWQENRCCLSPGLLSYSWNSTHLSKWFISVFFPNNDDQPWIIMLSQSFCKRKKERNFWYTLFNCRALFICPPLNGCASWCKWSKNIPCTVWPLISSQYLVFMAAVFTMNLHISRKCLLSCSQREVISYSCIALPLIISSDNHHKCIFHEIIS